MGDIRCTITREIAVLSRYAGGHPFAAELCAKQQGGSPWKGEPDLDGIVLASNEFVRTNSTCHGKCLRPLRNR